MLNIMTGSEDIAVIISGKHMCVSMRGIQDTNSVTDTAFFGGAFKTNSELRKELLDNINRK